MAAFYSVFGSFDEDNFEPSDPESFDIVSALPPELAITILRFLTPADLLNSTCVNRNWLNLIRCDTVLRANIRRHFRQQRKMWRSALMGLDSRRSPGPSTTRNAINVSANLDSQYIISNDSTPDSVRPFSYMPHDPSLTHRRVKVNPVLLSRENSSKSNQVRL